MARLQCRSYPLSVAIILDGKHTGKITPHTFELDPGTHTVLMHYAVPETGEIIEKTEEAELVKGKRTVIKQYFKEPKTLADVSELGK